MSSLTSTPVSEHTMPSTTSLDSSSLPDCLVLSGGGLKGLAMLGALQPLCDTRYFANIERIIGSSAGAVIGAFMAMGYQPRELFEILSDADLMDFFAPNLSLISEIKGGVCNTRLLEETFKKLIKDKRDRDEITLHEEYLKTGIELHFMTVNLATPRSAVILNHITAPTCPLYLAMRATCCVPGVFDPVHLTLSGSKPMCLVDGGLEDNFPLAHAPVNSRVFGINFESKSKIVDITAQTGIKSVLSVLIASIEFLMSKSSTGSKMPAKPTRSCQILTIIDLPADAAFGITINKFQKRQLYAQGRSQGLSYLSTVPHKSYEHTEDLMKLLPLDEIITPRLKEQMFKFQEHLKTESIYTQQEKKSLFLSHYNVLKSIIN